jgi:hypothetical protein
MLKPVEGCGQGCINRDLFSFQHIQPNSRGASNKCHTISGQKAVHVDTVNLTAVWWFEAVKGRGGSGSRGKIRKSNASKCSVN